MPSPHDTAYASPAQRQRWSQERRDAEYAQQPDATEPGPEQAESPPRGESAPAVPPPEDDGYVLPLAPPVPEPPEPYDTTPTDPLAPLTRRPEPESSTGTPGRWDPTRDALAPELQDAIREVIPRNRELRRRVGLEPLRPDTLSQAYAAGGPDALIDILRQARDQNARLADWTPLGVRGTETYERNMAALHGIVSQVPLGVPGAMPGSGTRDPREHTQTATAGAQSTADWLARAANVPGAVKAADPGHEYI